MEAVRILQEQLRAKEEEYKKIVEEKEKEIKQMKETILVVQQSLGKIEAKKCNEKEKSPKIEKQKYYVIFNGPMKGFYDDWSKTAIHVQGKKDIIYKPYSTIEEAKQAWKENQQKDKRTFSEIARTPMNPNKRNRLNMAVFQKPPTISLIPTTQQVNELKTMTEEKFKKCYRNLTHYTENLKMLSFYPKETQAYGPKAIILPEASSVTVYEFFNSGLTDCIYTKKEKIDHMFKLFPDFFKQSLHQYADKVAKEREMFLKTYSIYPLFEEGRISQTTFSIIKLGVSNSEYPTLPEKTSQTELTKEEFFINYILNYKGVCEQTQKIKLKSKLNYKSPTIIMTSSNRNSTFTDKEEAVISVFERPILDLTYNMKIPEEIRKRLCEEIQGIGNHCCNYCENDTTTEKESEQDIKEDSAYPFLCKDANN